MENFEVVLHNVDVAYLNDVLELLQIEYQDILSCHFFQHNQDICEYRLVDLRHYFDVPSTGYLKVRKCLLGIEIEEPIIVLSGHKPFVEITINFTYNKRYEQMLWQIKEQLSNFRQYSSHIAFGFEPLDKEDVLLYL